MKKLIFGLFLSLFCLSGARAQSIDATKWTSMNEFSPRNSEAECYWPAQNAISGGAFVQTAAAKQTSCSGGSSAYASGELESVFKFAFGTVKYHAKFAGGVGTWPAIWLLGANCQPKNGSTKTGGCPWPAAGSNEIDITEIKNGSLTSPWQNVVDTGGSWFTCRPTITDVSKNFHDYEFDWTSSSLVWKIDGATTCTESTASFVPQTPMFLIINVALGGAGGGSITNSTLPQSNTVTSLTVTQNGAVVFDSGFGSAATVVAPAAPTKLAVSTN